MCIWASSQYGQLNGIAYHVSSTNLLPPPQTFRESLPFLIPNPCRHTCSLKISLSAISTIFSLSRTPFAYLERDKILYGTVFIKNNGLSNDLLESLPVPWLETGVPQGDDDGQFLFKAGHRLLKVRHHVVLGQACKKQRVSRLMTCSLYVLN